jgi:ketosteroid isomerase-like protein
MHDIQANKRFVREFIEALGTLHKDRFLSYLTEDVWFETPGQFPAVGIKTKAQVAKEFPAMCEVLPWGLKFTVLTMTAEESRVNVELNSEAKTVDGCDYNSRYHYAIVVSNGKISSFRDYMDSHLVMRVLVPTFTRHGAVQTDGDRENSAIKTTTRA